MNFQVDQLSALIAAVDHGTFDAAARELNVTPSAISQRVKALEEAAGRVLLQRVKPIRPTSSGEAVLRLARQVALLQAETTDLLSIGDSDDTSGDEPGDTHLAFTTIPLVINSDSLATWALPALAQVTTEHRVTFDVYREDQDYSTARLRDGSVMAAVTSSSEPVAGCEVRRLGKMHYRPMASRSFANRWFPDGATAAALRAAPMVVYDRSDDLQDHYLRRHAGRRVDPPRSYVPASAEMATAVLLGLGWGMVPEAQLDELQTRGDLVSIGDDGIDVVLYWQQWRLRSRLLTAVADAVAAAAIERLR